MNPSIGFMQGRLSPIYGGQIQSFPWETWKDEFKIANQIGFTLMEWTLDHEGLIDNPLMTQDGRNVITQLSKKYKICIPSLTGDCFMQAPFWKARDDDQVLLEELFINVVKNCASLKISMIVLPLVDNGKIEDISQEDYLVSFLKSKESLLKFLGVKVLFESDYSPPALARFIKRFDSTMFGINYDIGNSSSLGYDVKEEIREYGKRIVNIHVKDRLLHGTTVPLGTGNAKFDDVFTELKKIHYVGNFILQTARAGDGDHAKALLKYREQTEVWLNYNAS
jgi:L-ribulose-5-phosphate 3-epimerase